MNATHAYPPRNTRYWRLAAGLLLAGGWVYYRQYFGRPASLALTVYLLGLIYGMLYFGMYLGHRTGSFPTGRFLGGAVVASALRWAVTYCFLRDALPPETVFHYPARAIWFLVPTSALMVFTGYGMALYRNRPPASAQPPAVDLLRFRAEGRDVLLPVNDLLLVSARGEYALYQCADRQYSRFQRLKDAERELRPYGFHRIHRSHVVAQRAIRSAGPRSVTLINDREVPVSSSYRATVRELMRTVR